MSTTCNVYSPSAAHSSILQVLVILTSLINRSYPDGDMEGCIRTFEMSGWCIGRLLWPCEVNAGTRTTNTGLIIEEIPLYHCYSEMLIEAGLAIQSGLFSTFQKTPFLTTTAYSQPRLLRTASITRPRIIE